jgi:hypothetical protein
MSQNSNSEPGVREALHHGVPYVMRVSYIVKHGMIIVA